jgi:hypothetical protein
VSEVPSEEQERLARELAEELRKLRVEDLLVSTLMHVSSIGYRRLGTTADTRDERDLDQVRLAIETMRALTPVLERFVPGDLVRDFNASVASLQLAYAKAASEARVAPADAAAPGDAEANAASAEAAPAGQSPGHGREAQEDVAASDLSGGQSPGRGKNGQEGATTPE